MSDQQAAHDAAIRRLEDLGPAQVRLLLSNGGWPQALHMVAVEWLAKVDREDGLQREKAQAEQVELARRATAATEEAATSARSANAHAAAANRIALGALIAALAALVVSIIGIVVGKH